ncbi:hypothetical protein [Kitasatospora sp. HPMI-4]|uniref:hypothetical protein n=1 Tax=Kitasatospora sp. HPMI-4 TaxID=3448443 RepID=UPI003F1C0A25
MYSYDVAPHRPSAAARSIPGMRPSYDAEHPSSPTPIYDALYSEYRRLFRALPGDRTGEEDLRFTGFAVRDTARDGYFGRDSHPVREALPPGDSYAARGESYGARAELAAYPPQHQAFDTYPGHAQGTPQFMPNQQGSGGGQYAAGQYGAGQQPTGAFMPGQVTSGQFSAGQFVAATGEFGPGQHTAGPAGTGRPATGQSAGQSAAQSAAQSAGSGQYPAPAPASGGQGWVASGYLAPAQPVASGIGEVNGFSGRHRGMLSLPPGRIPGQG